MKGIKLIMAVMWGLHVRMAKKMETIVLFGVWGLGD